MKRQVNCSSDFASLFIVVTHKSSANFKLIHFLLWIKEFHRSPNFETFECCGKHFPCSSCHFPNHTSVFLQIFYRSSVSWNIIPPYLFSLNTVYFVQKDPIKKNIFDTLEYSGQNSSNSSCQFLFESCIILHSHDT